MEGHSNIGNETAASRVLVVEDDSDIRLFVCQHLRSLGYVVDEAEDGRSGWTKAESSAYDIIVLDWKFGGDVSGLAFLNRIRQTPSYEHIPILIVSGYLSSKDLNFLVEVPLSDTMQKPFRQDKLGRKVATLLREGQWYQRQDAIIKSALDRILSDKDFDSFEVCKRIIEASPKPLPLWILAGKFMRSRRFFDFAERFLTMALALDGKSAVVLNELGKVLLEIGNIEKARSVLELAQKYSPNNVDRLCILGEVSLRQFDPDNAKKFFDQAADIDATSEYVKSGQHLTANIAEFLVVCPQEDVPTSYASLLNAVGVSMVKHGDFEKGLKHYVSALKYLNQDLLKAKLAYNLGLGYIKWQRQKEGIEWLEKAIGFDTKFKKAVELYHRLVPVEDRMELEQLIDEPSPLGFPELPREPRPVRFREEDADQHKVSRVVRPIIDEDELDEPCEFDSGIEAGSEPSSETPGEEVNKDSELPYSQEDLVSYCPELKDLFQMLKKEGIYLPAQIPVIRNLLIQYGSEALGDAIRYALAKKIPSAFEIAQYVERHYPKIG